MEETKSEQYKELRLRDSEGTAAYVANILAQIVLIYIFNNLTGWFSFINGSFGAILWLFNISFVANIVFSLIFIFYSPAWFRSFLRLLLNLFSLVIFYAMLVIFPFDLNVANQQLVVLIIYLVLFGTSIAVLVELVKVVKYLVSSNK